MGWMSSLVDATLGTAVRTVVTPAKVIAEIAAGEDLEEVLGDTVGYVVNGTSADPNWDGHNTTGRTK